MHKKLPLRRLEKMCFVCDGIAEPCGWQRAVDLDSHFAGWIHTPCGMCDDEFDEFVAELGLNPQVLGDLGSQEGQLALTLEARLHANEEAPGRAPPLERAFPIGTQGLHPLASREIPPWSPLSPNSLCA